MGVKKTKIENRDMYLDILRVIYGMIPEYYYKKDEDWSSRTGWYRKGFHYKASEGAEELIKEIVDIRKKIGIILGENENN